MLAQPLVARGVSTRYITSGTRPIVEDLLAGESAYFFAVVVWMKSELILFAICNSAAHETLLGLKKVEAGSELVLKKRVKKAKKAQGQAQAGGKGSVKAEEVKDEGSEGEEWVGITS